MMKFSMLTLGILTLSSFAVWQTNTTEQALAQCVQADVSVQYNVNGSKRPSRQTNDVTFDSAAGCRGNTSVTTGVQGNVGGSEPVEQHRRVRHRQSGNPKRGGSTVQIQSNPTIDVYNHGEQYR